MTMKVQPQSQLSDFPGYQAARQKREQVESRERELQQRYRELKAKAGNDNHSPAVLEKAAELTGADSESFAIAQELSSVETELRAIELALPQLRQREGEEHLNASRAVCEQYEDTQQQLVQQIAECHIAFVLSVQRALNQIDELKAAGVHLTGNLAYSPCPKFWRQIRNTVSDDVKRLVRHYDIQEPKGM